MVAEIRMYELLKEKFGEKDAKTFVQLFQDKMDYTFEQKKNDMATKKDVNTLKDDLATLRADLLRTIYLTSLGQVVAIVASVVTLVLILK